MQQNKTISLAETQDKVFLLLKAAGSKKAFDPVILRLAKITPLADFFLIMTGTSARHVKAVCDEIIGQAKTFGFSPESTEGVAAGNWALLDFGDVIVHIFQQKTRDFYDLEGLWSEAPRVTIPQEIYTEMESGDYSEDDDDFTDEFEEE